MDARNYPPSVITSVIVCIHMIVYQSTLSLNLNHILSRFKATFHTAACLVYFPAKVVVL